MSTVDEEEQSNMWPVVVLLFWTYIVSAVALSTSSNRTVNIEISSGNDGNAHCLDVKIPEIELNEYFLIRVFARNNKFDIQNGSCNRLSKTSSEEYFIRKFSDGYNDTYYDCLMHVLQASLSMKCTWNCSIHFVNKNEPSTGSKNIECYFELHIQDKEGISLKEAPVDNDEEETTGTINYIYAACGAVAVMVGVAVVCGFGLYKRKQTIQNQALVQTQNVALPGPMTERSLPDVVYATPLDTRASETYSEPYVPSSVHKPYNNPIPKDLRWSIKLVYAEIEFNGPSKPFQHKASVSPYASVQFAPTRMRAQHNDSGL